MSCGTGAGHIKGGRDELAYAGLKAAADDVLRRPLEIEDYYVRRGKLSRRNTLNGAGSSLAVR